MIAGIIFSVVAGVLLLPLLSDLLALAVVAFGRARPASQLAGDTPRLLYLIPAHNEEEMISSCVASVLAQSYPRGRVTALVLADNCSDRTAERARAAGVACVERSDAQHRGKPHALRWAFERLDLTPYDAVVILDADAVVAPDHAAALARRGDLRGKAVESYDDVRNPGDSALTRMAAVFAAARFRAAYQLKQRAGLNIPLSDGLCIGTDVLGAYPWSAMGLSEDIELYIQLTSAGVPIELAADAHLYAQETRSLPQSRSQRSRWLAGRLDVLLRLGPGLMRSRSAGWRQKLDAFAEISAPGPALHVAAASILLLGVGLTDPVGASALVVAIVLPLVRHAAYAAVGVWCDAQPLRAVAAFAFLPVYAVWRCVVAVQSLALLRGGAWIRTAR
jgi:1,2-diacylglycerol 3-beta-glucosyltransferase